MRATDWSSLRSSLGRIGLVTAVMLGALAVPQLTTVASATTVVTGPTDLGTLGGSYSSATDVSDAGMVVGYSAMVGDVETHGFAWTAAGGMVDVGVLPGGTSSYMFAVNASGQAVGQCDRADGQSHACSWTAGGGLIDLGTLGGTYSVAYGVADSGLVGGYAALPGDATYHAFAWTAADGMVDLGALGHQYSVVTQDPGSVSAAGHISGDFYDDSGFQHAFVWTAAGGMVDLGVLPGTTFTYVPRVSAAGQVIGISGSASGSGVAHYHGFSWTQSGGMVDLGHLGNPADDAGVVSPVAVSDAGQVVGSAPLNNHVSHAFSWTSATGMTDLGTLPGGGSFSGANDVNDAGVVVGLSLVDSTTGNSHAMLWTEAGGMVDLGTLGGAMSEARRVNSSGLVAGFSWMPNTIGYTHAVVWQFNSSDGTVESTPPTISVTSPVDGANLSLGQSVQAAYSCADNVGGSGVATCTGDVASGAAIDTSTAGPHTFTVSATDGAGNPATTSATYTVHAGDADEAVTGGEIVTTDPGGVGASSAVPVQTSIAVPNGVAGQIVVTPHPFTSSPPNYALLGKQVEVTAPDAPSAASPYVATFTIDASALAGLSASTPVHPADLQVFRDGVIVPTCTDASAAVPDPCVESRGAASGGDAALTVRTTQFGTWSLGRAAFGASGPTDLGTLGGTTSIATAVSGGVVVGYSDIADNAAQHAFVYDTNAPSPHMVDLGTLGGSSSHATGIDGSIVVGSSDTTDDEGRHAFAYDLADPSPHMVDIDNNELDDASFSGAVGVNGHFIAGAWFPGSDHGVRRGFVYDLAAATPHMIDIGTLGGGGFHATDVAGFRDNTVVGTSSTPGGGFQGFAYDAAAASPHMVAIGTLSGAQRSSGAAVSGHVVVGQASTTDDDSLAHPVASDVTAASPHLIDLDPSGTAYGNAQAIDGSVITGSRQLPGGNHAFVYDLAAASPHLVDLGTLSGGTDSNGRSVKNGVVVGSSGGPTAMHAFAYDTNAASPHLIDLGTLGGNFSFPNDIDDSLVVGSAATTSGATHAALWPLVASPDGQPPVITATTPAEGDAYSLDQPVTASYSCTDSGSGVASCAGDLPPGAAIDTTASGPHTFTINASDNAGNTATKVVHFVVRAGDASQPVTGGETVSTDPGGVGASPTIPVQTRINVPAGVSGQVTITPQPAGTPPTGFVLFGTQVVITAPIAPSPASPYVASFTIDASALGGISPNDIQVFRNGVVVPDCTSPTAATPNPCVAARGSVPDASGDAFIGVRTTQFSTWSVGRRALVASTVTPSSRPQGLTHQTISVTGAGFVTGSSVSFPSGGVTVSGTTFVDAGHLNADVSVAASAAVGARDVKVTNPGAHGLTATCAHCFAVTARPAISALTPNARPQGASHEQVTLTGSNLQAGATVTISGSGVVVNSVSGGGSSLQLDLSVTNTAATGARDVTVANPDGGSVTKSSAFTVTAKPAVTGLSPSAVARSAAATVQILGSGFATGVGVSFGTDVTVTSLTRNSATKLTAKISVGAGAALGTRNVTVNNADGGNATCVACLTVNAAPTVTNLAPSSRAQGTTHQLVTVTGTGYQAGVAVAISGSGVTVNAVTRNGPTSLALDVSIASGAATGARNVTVTNVDGGAVTCAGCFTVNPKPTISSVAPNSRARGGSYSIVITGSGFQGGATVVFAGTGIQVNSVTGNATTRTVGITIAANAAKGSRDITITNPDGGTVTKGSAFKVT